MFEMAQIRHALKLEKETAKNTSFTTLFSTPGNRKRMTIIVALAIFSQWRSVIFSVLLRADAYMHPTPVETVSFRIISTWSLRVSASRTPVQKPQSMEDSRSGT